MTILNLHLDENYARHARATNPFISDLAYKVPPLKLWVLNAAAAVRHGGRRVIPYQDFDIAEQPKRQDVPIGIVDNCDDMEDLVTVFAFGRDEGDKPGDYSAARALQIAAEFEQECLDRDPHPYDEPYPNGSVVRHVFGGDDFVPASLVNAGDTKKTDAPQPVGQS